MDHLPDKAAGSRLRPLWLFGWLLSACALLWVAWYNHYPVVYADTASYLINSKTPKALFPYRSLVYSAFIRAASFGFTPWLVVIAQALLVSTVLYHVFDYLVPASKNCGWRMSAFAAMILFLVAATSLPWFVGQIMPDVFTPLLFLSLFLLLYDASLSTAKRIFHSCVFGVSLGAHLSHFPIVALLLAALLAVRGVPALRPLWWPATRRQVTASILCPALIACLSLCVMNQSIGLGFRLAPSQDSFLFARMLPSGLAARYLQEQCPKETFAACRDLGNFPRNEADYLFRPNALFTDMGGFHSVEAGLIVRGIIREYPVDFAKECIRQTFWQFISFKTTDTAEPYGAHFIARTIYVLFPADWNWFRNSAQWSGQLLRLSDKLEPWHIAVFWLCLTGNLLFVLLARPLGRVGQFFCMGLLMLICNAMVTGSLAGVFDRYQSRAAWLMPLCFVFYTREFFAEKLQTAAGRRHPAAAIEAIHAAEVADGD